MTFENIRGLDVRWSSSEDIQLLPRKIQSVITSPPYWNLKDYGHQDQIGTSDETYDDYLSRIRKVFGECYKNLSHTGTMWVVADSFVDRGDTKLLPYHLAKEAQKAGFILQNIIVWYKPTAIAGYNDRTVVNKKEYIVFLSKESDYKLRVSQDTQDGSEDPANVVGEKLNNIWRHPVKRGSLSKTDVLHKAPYPVSLAKRIVQISTEEGEFVLDPFLGSGTTALAALNENRRCVGYEINREFESVIEERLDVLKQKTLSER